MVIWHGILTVKPGKREAYIEEIKRAGLIEKFLGHPGNVFYNIAAAPYTYMQNNPEAFDDAGYWDDVYEIIRCALVKRP